MRFLLPFQQAHLCLGLADLVVQHGAAVGPRLVLDPEDGELIRGHTRVLGLDEREIRLPFVGERPQPLRLQPKAGAVRQHLPEIGQDGIRVEPHHRLAGFHEIAVLDEDFLDDPALQVLNRLDVAGRFDLTRRRRDLVDGGHRRPDEKRGDDDADGDGSPFG